MMSLVPVVAISPILLYGAQASQETPKSHPPPAIVPSAAAVGIEKLGQSGIFYEGLSVLGGRAILSSLILPSVAVFAIERQFLRAATFALAGAVLTFFGFMHGEQIGLAQSPAVALSYLLVSGGSPAARGALPRSSRADEALEAIPQPAD
jgi:adenine/guanine/hypoxanthine permease